MLAKSSPADVTRPLPPKSRFFCWSGFFIVFGLVLTSACSHDTAATLASASFVARAAMPGNAEGALPARLDPRYRYLRVQVSQATPALMVLGYLDPHPLGPIEVWYSATGEVLKLQNGRVVATQGLATDWPMVRFERAPVAWAEVGVQASTYVRLRDEIPSYRYGLRQTVAIEPYPQAPMLEGLTGIPTHVAAKYRWYREAVQGSDGSRSVSWFALGLHRGVESVVFSEQCIAANLCLHIQPWPVDEGDL